KNFFGGIILFFSKVYKVGDRIEINSEIGDVVDIHLLYTTVMESKNWIDGEQATGRLKMIPNSNILTSTINNYTKDHSFIWDEISIPITYESNWKKAHESILKIVQNETKEIIKKADKEISQLSEKYYLGERPTKPAVFMKLTDNWITLNVRYVTHTRERRMLHHKLSKMILEKIEQSKDIKIASQTIEIVGFPKLQVNNSNKK
ncbi:MAG: mechanosensitive ion channel family protein, partial [Nanoarchaeota archaeon]|nr:mechanosensitive ion channel family protein [Nanoarchaeota archaeon]